jgi:uncharacterized protein YdhG (YjbR/CyaY superfamily)
MTEASGLASGSAGALPSGGRGRDASLPMLRAPRRLAMKRDDRSPQAYRESVEGAQRELLEALRAVVREAAPDVEERCRFGMLDDPGLANLATQKRSVHLHVMPEVPARLAGVDRGKSCLRFARLDQVDAPSLRALLDDVRAARADPA